VSHEWVFLEGREMALVRWSDWDPFKSLEKAFEMIPEKLFGERLFEARFPALDVEDKGDYILVTAELPGVKEEDISVELHGDRLTIRGEKKEDVEKEDAKRKYYYRERSFGSFQRVVMLGEEVDTEGAEAVFEDGVLKVKLNKAAAKKAQRIAIKKKKQ